MNKLIKLVASMLILFSVLLGSDQRIKTLGGNAMYWPGDDSNIELFPQLINDYNIAQISGINSSDSLHGKLIWGDKTKYGFSWKEDDKHNLLNFYMGTGSMGLRLGLLSEEREAGDDKESELGLSGSIGAQNDNLDIGLHASTYSTNDGTSNDQYQEFNSDLYFRMGMDAWVFNNMAASMHYKSNNGDPDNALDYQRTWLEMNLGFFNTIQISDNATAMLALSTSYLSLNNYEGSDVNVERIQLPNFTFGVEGKITDWAKARIGLNKNYTLTLKANEPGESTVGLRQGEDLAKAFGLGFNYGAFNLDLYVTEALFTNPVQHIIGFENLEPDSAPNGGAVSATVTYSW
tara:strand:- start:318 stop:1358 length:1041 start_codon:yes stop_codon:yes gene_type:complete